MCAHRLMGMVASPSICNFQAMVHLNMLKDCPVTNNDICNAHDIYGPDLPSIRGKMVRRKPEQVITDYVEIQKKNCQFMGASPWLRTSYSSTQFHFWSWRHVALTKIPLHMHHHHAWPLAWVLSFYQLYGCMLGRVSPYRLSL